MNTENIEMTQKDKDLSSIDGRIRGLMAIKSVNGMRVAEEKMLKDKKILFGSHGVVKPINVGRIDSEIARLEAARKDVAKRKN